MEVTTIFYWRLPRVQAPSLRGWNEEEERKEDWP